MNCSFNIRYKPRTTRQFTKNDLTVYDSAGNTALNALTVYGKSEVVDGAIVSAGEGYAVVRLADLTWVYFPTQNRFYATLANAQLPAENTQIAHIYCAKYVTRTWEDFSEFVYDDFIAGVQTYVGIRDTNYNTVEGLVASLGDATLAYKLADPTQGNCIAVKTDNGSGIDGTMAVFETGTPLRGIPETDVRDVMTWDGSAGTVTKNCGKVRLADLTWFYDTTSSLNPFFWTDTTRFPSGNIKYSGVYSKTLYNLICSKYSTVKKNSAEFLNKTLTVDGSSDTVYQLQIKDTDYTTASDFVTALGDAELVYELASPTTEQLTSTENTSIAGLRTFEPQTHAQNNAGAEMTVDYTIRVPTI